MTSGFTLASASASFITLENSRSTITHLGVGVVEREGDDRGIEPRVERVENALAHRHAVMALEHGRRIGEQHRHRVAAPDAALGQRRRQPARARVELAVAAPQRPVDDGRVVGKDGGRALQEIRAASAADNWPGCGQDRCRMASSPSVMPLDAPWSPVRRTLRRRAAAINRLKVIAGHSRPKNGVLSHAYVPAIPITMALCLPS